MHFQHPLVRETWGKYPHFESEEGEGKDSRKTKLKHSRENFKIWISKISLTTYPAYPEHWDRCPDHDITSQEFYQFSKSYLTHVTRQMPFCSGLCYIPSSIIGWNQEHDSKSSESTPGLLVCLCVCVCNILLSMVCLIHVLL